MEKDFVKLFHMNLVHKFLSKYKISATSNILFESEIFDFLSELKWNNNRVWFSENKQRFDGLQKELVLYTANLLSEIERFDESVRGIDPKS